MKYNNIVRGTFLSRPNRFTAVVDIDGSTTVCHVKNTGRCLELLVRGCEVFLEKSSNPERKTMYDVVAVMKGDRCVNIDSIAPNVAVGEWLRKGALIPEPQIVKPEFTYKTSRFDYYVGTQDSRQCFVEVKGVTLENDGVVMFPDAPTERGVKHLKELMDCVKEGFEAYVVFVVQMKNVKYFTPNTQTHKEFADTLKLCAKSGVNVVCVDCNVTPDSMEIADFVKVEL